jgi:8-oxo-dGTP pyrophosphatase MutT (NUDIX family)
MSREPDEEPIARRAARVILVDPAGRTLLLHGYDPARPEDGTWWLTPGGGIEPGESAEAAARREVREETGLELPPGLGPVVLHRLTRFSFEGRRYEQTEDFFVAAVPGGGTDRSGWTEIERRSMHGVRWWSVEELRATTDTVYPENLADLLADLLAELLAGRREPS